MTLKIEDFVDPCPQCHGMGTGRGTVLRSHQDETLVKRDGKCTNPDCVDGEVLKPNVKEIVAKIKNFL